jgi:protein-S-isoprenylcysteine O-methyltransferase Ste14
MYLSVVVILIGWAVGYRSESLLAYAGIVGALFQWRVVCAEEPWAARLYGDAWRAYRTRTPRWLRQPRPSIDR